MSLSNRLNWHLLALLTSLGGLLHSSHLVG